MTGTEKVRCAKCGVSSKEEPFLTFHRFPSPGKQQQTLKARVWAYYCFPTMDWTSEESLYSLNAQHKVLCGKHFDNCSFTSSNRKRLNKFAIPAEAQEILREQQCGSSISAHNSDKNIPKAPGRITIPPLEPRDIQAVPSASRQVDKGIPDTHDDDSDWFDDDDVLFHDEVISDTENGVVLPARSRDIQDEHFYNPKEHEGYSCNVCAGAIVGFRYVCVQCRDWDMCGTCEAAGSHAAHYVLRVPAPRAFAEMKSVLDAVRKALELSAHDPLYSGAPLRPDAALDADEIKSEKEWDGSNNVATNIEVPCEFIPEIEGNVSTVNDIDATENDNDMTDHLNDTTDHLNDTTDLRNDTTDHRNDTSSDHSDSFENRSENTENYDVITKNKHYASRKENNGENYYEDVTYLDDILEDEEMTAEDSKTINDLTEPSEVPYSKTSKHHFDQLLTGKNKPPKRPEKEMPKTYMVQFAAGDKRADNVERKKLCNTAKIQPKVVVKRLQIPKNVIRLRLKQIVSKTKKS